MKNMINKSIELLSSFRTTVVLMVFLAVILATATWVEENWGTSVAGHYIYRSPFLFLLQLLLVVNFFMYASRHKYLTKDRLGLMFTHLSFIIILAGAVITHFYGKEGLIHLREGETTEKMFVRNVDDQVITSKLPFTIQLNDFVLKRYPGSGSPSSYESFVTINTAQKEYTAHIYMNNVVDVEGYRLYQASFDSDEKGSVLSVNHDVIGKNVTYTGYVLLLIGLIFSLAGKNSRFRKLFHHLKILQTNKTALIGFLLSYGLTVCATSNDAWQTVERYRVNEPHAARWGILPMQSEKGRMMPINTFSSEILRKLYKADRIGSLNSDQFLLSLLLMPDVWAEIPCIAIDDADLCMRYGITKPYASFTQLFDQQGNYKLQRDLEAIYQKDPSKRNRSDKNLLKLDEQANIFYQLTSRRLLRLFPLPEDTTHTWYAPGDDLSIYSGKDSMFVSRIFDWYLEEVIRAIGNNDWKTVDEVLGMIGTYQQAKATGVDISPQNMRMEVKYNQQKIFARCQAGYLILGGLSLLWAILTLIGMHNYRLIRWLLSGSVLIVFGFHIYGMGLRWYVSGYAPWSNSYETMVYVAWATVLAGLLFVKRDMLVFALAVLFGGIILFVSGLNWMDPQITTLVPVLKSPWLMFHVAVVVAAYGFFGLSALIGTANHVLMCLIYRSQQPIRLRNRIRELSIINEMSLWVGLVLMTTGIFLGAVWANESWGRYWGWDPKETWALITMLVYAVVTHIHLLKWRQMEWLFNFLSVCAFSSVLMTFFGVNYFLSGMHSYGQNDQISNLFVWLGLAFILLFLLFFLSWHSIKKYFDQSNINLK